MKRVLIVFFAVMLIGTTLASEISVSPPSTSITQGDNFIIDIIVNASSGLDNLYAIQLDIDYDPNILRVNSVTEGDFLNGDGAVTIFSSGSNSSGSINDIYIARNVTDGSPNMGISGQGTLLSVDFTALSPGTSTIGVSGIIWVNSTITNNSASTLTPTIINGSVIINASTSGFCGDATCNNGETCSTCAGDCGVCPVDTGGGGGSGGGGGGGTARPKTNITTNKTDASIAAGSESSTDNIGGSANEQIEGNAEAEEQTAKSTGFFSLTGRAIGNAAKTAVTSWVFYFIIVLITIFFVANILIKKYKKHKGFDRVSKY